MINPKPWLQVLRFTACQWIWNLLVSTDCTCSYWEHKYSYKFTPRIPLLFPDDCELAFHNQVTAFLGKWKSFSALTAYLKIEKGVMRQTIFTNYLCRSRFGDPNIYYRADQQTHGCDTIVMRGKCRLQKVHIWQLQSIGFHCWWHTSRCAFQNAYLRYKVRKKAFCLKFFKSELKKNRSMHFWVTANLSPTEIYGILWLKIGENVFINPNYSSFRRG